MGLLAALEVTVKVAERAPSALGVKVMLILQLSPAASVFSQVLVSAFAKSLLCSPARVIRRLESSALPVFFRVRVFSALVSLTG